MSILTKRFLPDIVAPIKRVDTRLLGDASLIGHPNILALREAWHKDRLKSGIEKSSDIKENPSGPLLIDCSSV